VTQLFRALTGGIALGSIYSLLGLSFVIIYKATGVVSFAQPAMMVLGAWWTIYFATIIGLNFFLAVLIAAVLAAIVAAVIERIALRPMVGKPVFAAVMVTIGIDVIVRTIAHDLIGPQLRAVGDPWGLDTWRVGEIVIAKGNVAATAAAAIVVALLLLFYRYTRYGLAMRATSFDQETSLAQGIPVGRMFGLSWAIGGALAAVAGTFVGATTGGIGTDTWVIALKALPVIILGGLDSIGGAVIAGIAIGIAEVFAATYAPQYAPWLGPSFSLVVPYLVMLLVLLVKPYGLFGTAEVERV
jgi:branched-chain amino acid transport system permease protein